MLQLDGVQLGQGAFSITANWSVPAGSVTALIGPSGGGKSTVLAGIAGFLPLSRGRVIWAGQDMSATPPGARPIAMLFQDNNLFPHLTVAQNIGLGLVPRLRLTSSELEQVEAVLRQVGLIDMGMRKPAQLSGGQQSRVALARVLISDKPLVMLDEPFSALGPGLRDDMLDLAVQSLGDAGRTMLMVTHDPADARRVAQNVVFVNAGVAATPMATKALFASPPPDLRSYLGT